MPLLPIDIDGNDTLKLNIMCGIIVNKGGLIVDTMYVETLLDSYTEIIAIDSSLQTGIDVKLTDKIVVYPNPFTNKISFIINNKGTDEVSIQFFDISGKKVVDIIKFIDGNVNNTISINLDGENDLMPGSYFYRIKSGNMTDTGKLIKVE